MQQDRKLQETRETESTGTTGQKGRSKEHPAKPQRPGEPSQKLAEYRCDVCGAMFREADALTKHKLIHGSGEMSRPGGDEEEERSFVKESPPAGPRPQPEPAPEPLPQPQRMPENPPE